MKKYIKLMGNNGSGKTYTVRKILEQLTGKSPDFMENIYVDNMLCYHKCTCGKYGAMGKFREGLKCCGMDKISGKSKDGESFAYLDRLQRNVDKIRPDVLFDEGLINITLKTLEGISKFTDFYLFYLDYPIELCRKSIIELRQGKVSEGLLERRKKSHDNIYTKINVKKYGLNGKTVVDNMKTIIEITGITPCRCMATKSVNPQQVLIEETWRDV